MSALDRVITVFSIISVPLHIFLMIAMSKAKGIFSPGFYVCVMNLCVCHILASTIRVFFDAPSNVLEFRPFLLDHPTIDWIVGLICSARTTWLKWTMQSILAIVAMNRLVAVIAPMFFHKENYRVMSIACYVCWGFFITIRLPAIWPLHHTVYHPTDDPDRTIYRVEETWALVAYIWIGIGTGSASLLIAYFSYTIIIAKMVHAKLFGNQYLAGSVKRTIAVSLFSSLGLFVMNFIETGEEVTWRMWKTDIVSTDNYYLLVNLGYEYSIISLPVTMLLTFSELRQRIFRLMKINRSNTVHVATISAIHSRLTPRLVKIGKSRRVVLRQGGGDAGSGRNTVDVQVLRDGGDGSRRNTIDLQFKEGRSRKNTLELKVNGEVVPNPPEPSDPSMNNSPRTLSIVRSGTSSRPATPLTENQRNNQVDNSARWTRFNPLRQFYLLKGLFITMCLVDIIHWAYLLRDDSTANPNSWRFYKRFESFDLYYLVARMFADIFTCVLGLGAAMWTRKPLLTLPCTTIQLLFLIIRAVVWAARSFNRGLDGVKATSEDKIFVICEFAIPLIWVLLSILIVRTTKRLRSYEQLHGYAHPPIIVLTVKNDDNDESVQIEIA